MGKVTGFMEYQRPAEAAEGVAERNNDYKEVYIDPSPSRSKQAARCMDCGIPFCTTGCPVNNIIPDWNDLVYHHDFRSALEVFILHQQFSRIYRAGLSGPM